MDWNIAFEQCPPYGEGRAPYEQRDTAVLAAMERSMEQLRRCVQGEGADILHQYLECRQEYARRCCRYYFYRGVLHGTREALDAWAEEYGS
mgnify:CR=1 FL=1